MTETVVRFGVKNGLVGILTSPAGDRERQPRPVVILLNAGELHRVGPNRLYVNLARNLAEKGFATLRMDFAGIGESFAERENGLSFDERATRNAQEAMNHLVRVTGAQRFVLMGLCTGGDVAFKASFSDDRVAGAVVINPTFGGDEMFDELLPQAEMRTRSRYYRRQLFRAESWKRVLTGHSKVKPIMELLCDKARRMLRGGRSGARSWELPEAWKDIEKSSARLLLVYSEGSTSFDLFQIYLKDATKKLAMSDALMCEIIQDVDHTFTTLRGQRLLIEVILDWVEAWSRE